MSKLVRVNKTLPVSKEQAKTAIAEYLSRSGVSVSAEKIHFATTPLYVEGPIAFAECSVVEVDSLASQLPLFPAK